MDFDAMDPFQAEAFAKASGKTVAELQDMIQAEKEIQYIRSFGTDEQKKQLKMMDELKRARETEAKDIGKQAEDRLMQQANQERINQLQNQFNKLMMELAKPVMDVAEPLLFVLTKYLPPILNAIKYMIPLVGMFKIFTFVASSIEKIGNSIKMFLYLKDIGLPFAQSMKMAFSFFQGSQATKVTGFIGKITGIFGKMGSFGGILLKTFGIFGKFLGPIGLVINAFTFITSLMKRWEETPKGILGGLEAIGGALYDTLIKPFVDAFNWIRGKSGFMANSPSVIGLGILDGIKSIGAALLDAITSPFRQGFNFISGYFGGPKLPSFSDMIGGKPVANTESMKNQAETSTSIIDSNKQMVDKLDELIGLMKSGGIAVNMDGSKVSTALGVATKFRGAY
jgi:hypothetical protein